MYFAQMTQRPKQFGYRWVVCVTAITFISRSIRARCVRVLSSSNNSGAHPFVRQKASISHSSRCLHRRQVFILNCRRQWVLYYGERERECQLRINIKRCRTFGVSLKNHARQATLRALLIVGRKDLTIILFFPFFAIYLPFASPPPPLSLPSFIHDLSIFFWGMHCNRRESKLVNPFSAGKKKKSTVSVSMLSS